MHGWERAKNGAVPPCAPNAVELQWNPKCFFVFPRTASLLVNYGEVPICITSLEGGMDPLEQAERIWERQQAVWTHLTGTFNPLSKVPLLTSSAICREIVLVLGQDCFIQKGRSSPGVLSARESGNHIVETMIYLVHGMSNNLSITSLQGYVFASPGSWHAAWSSAAFSHLIFVCSPATC